MGRTQSTRWLFQFLNVFIHPVGGCNLFCATTSSHNVLKPLQKSFKIHKSKGLMKGRCQGKGAADCSTFGPKIIQPWGGNNFSQLCLFTLALATLPTPPEQLPDVLQRTEERKLSNTNTIKLSGNLIGQLSRGTVAILLWGDNESHQSLLGWKKVPPPWWWCECVCLRVRSLSAEAQ